jgi:hypothetical protein
MHARLGTKMLGVAKINKRVCVLDNFDYDIATLTAVATIWPTKFGIFFTTKRDGSGAAFAAFSIYFCFV